MMFNTNRPSDGHDPTKTITRGKDPTKTFTYNKANSGDFPADQQHPKILTTDIQSICATQSKSQNELRILLSDDEILIRAKDQAERDKILDYVSSMELNRFVSVSSGCLTDGKLWCQDRRMLPSQKLPVPIKNELTEKGADLFKPRSQTFESLTALVTHPNYSFVNS